MCGIVAYIGESQAIDFLLQGLRALEYRGYDSTGIAILQNGQVKRKRSQGKLQALIESLEAEEEGALSSKIGIGHTRWATHGVASQTNAHPHSDTQSQIAIVHNGIINNYLELKKELIAKHDIQFETDTDTEVIAQLIALYISQDKLSLHAATKKAQDRLEGSYAICLVCQAEPEKIVLACCEAPLVIGIGKEKELYCASDSSALLGHTNRIIRLKDKQTAELSLNGKYTIFDDEGQIIQNPRIQTLNLNPLSNDKRGFKHYLLKEIHEQPGILRNLFSYHVDASNYQLSFPDLDTDKLTGIDKILLIGCGTAYYAGMLGKHIFENLAGIPTELEFASELLARRELLLDDKTLVIAISQSGETADTLAAVKKATKTGARLISLNNRPDSTLANLTEGACIYTQAGIEVSVAATKSFTAQLFCLYCLGVELALSSKKITVEQSQLYLQALQYLPQLIEQIISRSKDYKGAILPYAYKKAFIFLGRGSAYPLALEGALKLKELTYVQATGYAAGEMKHGPIATLDQDIASISLLLPGLLQSKTLHNVLEAKTRGAQTIAIVCDQDIESEQEIDTCLKIPSITSVSKLNLEKESLLAELVNPFLAVIPLQLISYHLAEYLGKDIDQPRNLAKSVTVE